MPAKKGNVRNLTRTPGVHERSPSWSPDGKWIAYYSDLSGDAAEDNIFGHFEKTAGIQTVLLVKGEPSREGACQVTVVPVSSDRRLRYRDWIEGNRRKVSEMTGGRVAYVYMPNTAEGGYTAFNRYFLSQQDKEAVIIDERFNGGGRWPTTSDILSRPEKMVYLPAHSLNR